MNPIQCLSGLVGVAEQIIDSSVKPAYELRQMGMKIGEIKEDRERSSDLVNAAWLLKNTPKWDDRTPAEILDEVDSIRF